MHLERSALTFSKAKLDDLGMIARELIEKIGKTDIWLFYGEMGAGKTTLIKTLGEELGVTDAMSSPTFSIVNEYGLRDDNKKIFHFDFYRLKNEIEAYDIGLEEYFYSGHLCFVEWPEKIPNLLPASYAKITLEIEDNTHRTIAVSLHDGKEKNRI